ncbi:hypothetical protein CC78DRAFT_138430 [Lojkania enalia]|uniref:Uncharacterized protein n=1 Tax=Lojkania enalia TaxID=147567 RepID=A0A9P4TRQ2_9PLEO|nr:hypothetical protein CC78DRAFT_138430 [Didymosphaeria enalia]
MCVFGPPLFREEKVGTGLDWHRRHRRHTVRDYNSLLSPKHPSSFAGVRRGAYWLHNYRDLNPPFSSLKPIHATNASLSPATYCSSDPIGRLRRNGVRTSDLFVCMYVCMYVCMGIVCLDFCWSAGLIG